MKIAIGVRLGTWFTGAALLLISSLVFQNRNEIVWAITGIYNAYICMHALLPVAEVFVLIDWIRKKKAHWKHIFAMLLMPICHCIYICILVGCTGGI